VDNTIFITMEGGVIQNINVTNNLDNIKAVVVDFDVQGVDESKLNLVSNHWAVIYSYEVDRIDDGDVEHFEKLIERSK